MEDLTGLTVLTGLTGLTGLTIMMCACVTCYCYINFHTICNVNIMYFLFDLKTYVFGMCDLCMFVSFNTFIDPQSAQRIPFMLTCWQNVCIPLLLFIALPTFSQNVSIGLFRTPSLNEGMFKHVL